MVGGFGEVSLPSEQGKVILESVKEAVEAKQGKTYTTFHPTHMRTQVVAGTNYLFKVFCNDGDIIHVKVHKPLNYPQEPAVLMNILPYQLTDTPLEYFE